MEQEQLGEAVSTQRLDPGRSFIYARFRTGNDIDRGEWTRAVHSGEFVGECACGGYLRPDPVETRGGRHDYEADCIRPASVHSRGFTQGCGKPFLAPSGRLGGRHAS
jgi:hypothetical protein